MHRNPVVVDANMLLYKNTMEFVSPEEFYEEIYNLPNNVCSYGEDKEAGIQVSILSHISFLFCVLSNLSAQGNLNVLSGQGPILILIKQYIEVLYSIECKYFSNETGQTLTLDKYIDAYFPGASTAIVGNIFKRSGEFWFVRYNNAFRMIKDKKGMDILEYLLSRPGNQIPFSELYIEIDKGNTEGQLSKTPYCDSECFDEEDMETAKLFSEADISKDDDLPTHGITPPSKKKNLKIWKLKKQLKKLESKIQNANPQDKITIQKSISELYTTISTLEVETYGEACYKKIKNALTKNVSDAKKYLKEVFPEFYDHLDKSLKTSNHYSPSAAIIWNTRYTAPNFQQTISGRKVEFRSGGSMDDLPDDWDD